LTKVRREISQLLTIAVLLTLQRLIARIPVPATRVLSASQPSGGREGQPGESLRTPTTLTWMSNPYIVSNRTAAASSA
jgi:hypothetical protein